MEMQCRQHPVFFIESEQIIVQVEAYTPDDIVPQVSAQLLNRNGDEMTELPVESPVNDGDPYQVLLPLSSFTRGDYLIKLSAKANDEESSTLVPFRIQ